MQGLKIAKLERAHFSKVQSGKITVCLWQTKLLRISELPPLAHTLIDLNSTSFRFVQKVNIAVFFIVGWKIDSFLYSSLKFDIQFWIIYLYVLNGLILKGIQDKNSAVLHIFDLLIFITFCS